MAEWFKVLITILWLPGGVVSYFVMRDVFMKGNEGNLAMQGTTMGDRTACLFISLFFWWIVLFVYAFNWIMTRDFWDRPVKW